MSSADRKHSHVFDEGNPLAERNTRWAVLLTVVMMVAEIAGGLIYNSMALLADGWHMSSHALALGLAVAAYAAARRLSDHPRFAFGTWKIEVLGGYTSAIFLIAIAGLMLVQSVERLISPEDIQYDQAILVAVLGLLVNLACAWLLKDDHHHHHHGHSHHHHDHHHDDHDHSHDHHEHHHDLNLRAAYLHVLTDAMTSLFAIVALVSGKIWGAAWLDPVMGIVGSVVVAVWAVGLIRETSSVLLDAEMDTPLVDKVRSCLESRSEIILTDLHIWRVGKQHYSCVIAADAGPGIQADDVKHWLHDFHQLVHVSVELNPQPV
ncbi:CDF family Co(II)/Ni(II) efflux transporter DmeF [uncultured Thalassolituus sp.]|uniref:CDF family Co(II)/Ni(II) efflux transporter DmeF n=2 Tax=Thalassolituus TaxID=187492 RepID=UPI00260C1366|nr:CDF family Co(II)/Ni(II) efflux transporter DmeF [uncultured Thalassolituus sp.]